MPPATEATHGPTIFRESDWIGTAKDFDTAPDCVKIALESQLEVPPSLEALFLPKPSASIPSLLACTPPPVASTSSVSPAGIYQFFSVATPSLTSIIPLLRSLPIPSRDVINGVLAILGQQWLDGKKSIIYNHLRGQEETFPFYVVRIWEWMHELHADIGMWAEASEWLRSRQGAKSIAGATADRVRMALYRIPWTAQLHGFQGVPKVTELTTFLSRKWLSTTHICLMVELLQHDMQRALDNTTVIHPVHSIQTPFLSQALLKAHAVRKLPVWLNAFGTRLLEGASLDVGFVANKDDNHWVALVVNFRELSILYADSLGSPIPSLLLDAIRWWRSCCERQAASATPVYPEFVIQRLPITVQTDDDRFSCGMLAYNALCHHYLPDRFALLELASVDAARMEIFEAVWAYTEDTISKVSY